MSEQYYWCRRHDRVESAEQACGEQFRLGPYPTPEAARNWREQHDTREERWAAEDRAWRGE